MRLVALELHMDGVHGAATPSGREQFIRDLSREIEFRRGDGCESGKPHEHLKRLRIPMTDETRKQPNAKYLESVANRLGLTGAKTRPTPGVLTHCATMDATLLLTTHDTRLYRSCVGALMYHVLDRADAAGSQHFRIVSESPHHWSDGSVAESDTIFAGNAGCVCQAAKPER